MKTTVKFLKSGRIVVEMRDNIVQMSPGEFYSVDTAEPFGDVGAEACVGVSEDVSPNALRSGQSNPAVFLIHDEAGISGNSNRNISRLHGWRGTTNDRSVTACGWRRIEESAPLKRGQGWRTVFSADLRPDEK